VELAALRKTAGAENMLGNEVENFNIDVNLGKG